MHRRAPFGSSGRESFRLRFREGLGRCRGRHVCISQRRATRRIRELMSAVQPGCRWPMTPACTCRCRVIGPGALCDSPYFRAVRDVAVDVWRKHVGARAENIGRGRHNPERHRHEPPLQYQSGGIGAQPT